MAEEKTPEQPRKETPKAAEPARTPADRPSREAAPGRQGEALPTEKPVPSRRGGETTQYVVTVDSRTGFAVRIERLDEETGERHELPLSAFAPDPTTALAYYQGYAAYLRALMPGI